MNILNTPRLCTINTCTHHLSGVYSVVDFTKVEAENVVSGNLMHTINNILGIISLNILMLKTKTKFNIFEIQNDIKSGIKPDFGFLVGFIRMNYEGEEDLYNNKYFKKILESIEFIEQNLYFNEEEKFLKKEINKEDLKKHIYNYKSIVESDKTLSNILRINDGYYIKFELTSYLGNTFKIEPILIELIDDLVNNSIKYSDEGTEIRVSITQLEDNIVISVLDEGYGIKQEDKSRVFEDKVRLDNVGNQKGSGEGGAKCAYVVDKLGGEIYIRSEVGIGTEIKIIMPNKGT